MYPSTVDVVRDFITSQTKSKVPSTEPGIRGQVFDYDGSVAQLKLNVHSSVEEFEELDKNFKSVKDLNGNSMVEFSRRYWDDPEFAKEQKRKIEEAKNKHGRS